MESQRPFNDIFSPYDQRLQRDFQKYFTNFDSVTVGRYLSKCKYAPLTRCGYYIKDFTIIEQFLYRKMGSRLILANMFYEII